MLSKFQKIQQWISFIPFWSTLFIAIVTYIELQKRKAPAFSWLKYGLNFFISAIVITIVNGVIMTGEHLVLNFIVSALLLFLTNMYFIHLQVEASQKGKNDENSQSTAMDKFKLFVKRHKIALIIVPHIIFAIVVTVFACYRIIYSFMISNEKTIEDSNGPDDFSVVSITDEEIANALYSKNTAFAFGLEVEGSSSDIADKSLKGVDYDKTRYSAHSISGIFIANATKTDDDSMKLCITNTVESGNMEVFVFIDNKLYREVNINEKTEMLLEGISGKTVYVKVACESAKMTVEVQREIGKTGDSSVSSTETTE